jgi:hypothetical protein
VRERDPSTGSEGAKKVKLQLDISKAEGKTPIYRGRWSEKQTVHLDPRAYRVSVGIT